MQLKSITVILILILFFVSISQAQTVDIGEGKLFYTVETDSWEPDDLRNNDILYQAPKSLVFPLSSISLSLIHIYQKKISPNSTTHRCPYKISCSNFAYKSISRKGFFPGILMFIDRYYYRENPGIPYLYPLYENEEGVLKLNDDFYLTGETY